MPLFSQKTTNDTSTTNTEQKKESSSGGKNTLEDQQSEKRFQQNIASLTAHLSLLEERYSRLRTQVQFTDHELIESKKNINSKMKALDQELDDLSISVRDIKDLVTGLRQEVLQAARKEDLAVLERYLDLWEPLSFATRDEVKRVIQEQRGTRGASSAKAR